MILGGALVVAFVLLLFFWIARKVRTGNQGGRGWVTIQKKGQSTIDPYPYIYVRSDGSARELHQDERDYLETPFRAGDGDLPYVKTVYSKRNGWNDLAGFLKRAALPRGLVVNSAPTVSPLKKVTHPVDYLRDRGLIVEEQADGTVRIERPKPS